MRSLRARSLPAGEFGSVSGSSAGEPGRDLRRHVGAVEGAEVKPTTPELIAVFQYAVKDLQFGHAPARDIYGFGKSRGACDGGDVYGGRNPAVTIPEEGHEKGPGSLDFIQAYLEHLHLACGLVSQVGVFDALAQVNGIEVMAAVAAQLFGKVWKRMIAKISPARHACP